MASTAPGIFVTVPKYVATNSNSPTLPKLRPSPVTAAMLKAVGGSSPTSSSGYASSNSGAEDTASPKGKKRRLDHLTWEEKVQRKKLKNRVAAQTSRDRKKARMEEMEFEIKDLTEKTEILQNKCESLQVINDSLLAKNNKLDMEVELLRQELNEIKEKQNNSIAQPSTHSAVVQSCAGCASINNGSAAGYTHGHTVDTQRVGTTAAKEQHTSFSMEDCGALPSLQDMLLDIEDDEEFDARRLEELAESLLADITANMEAGAGASDETAAQTASDAERLPGSVVGTTAECMESSGNRNNGLRSANRKEEAFKLQNTNECVALKLSGKTTVASTKSPVAKTETTTVKPPTSAVLTTPDTVYGTYDAKSNSITIVMDGDAVPVNEAVEEIYCEGAALAESEAVIKCPTPAASPSQVFLNVVNGDDSDDEEHTDLMNFDPIAKFFSPSRKLISPLAKSPTLSLHSVVSDHGYESIMGSPKSSTSATHFDGSLLDAAVASAAATTPGEDAFAWESSLNELFPSLI